MKQKIKLLSAVYLLYLLLNMLSGALEGMVSDTVFALSFLLPVMLALLYIRKEESGDIKGYLYIDGEGVKISVALAAPTLALVAAISYVTAYALELVFGDFPRPLVPDGFAVAVLSSALLPALAEEIMFRYLPIRVLRGVSKRGIIILSALFFAFAHASVYQIPYALFAGGMFMLVDLMTDSILPSVILHFLNNIFSLILIFFGENTAVIISVNVIGGLLFALSLVIFARDGKMIFEKMKEVFSKKEREEYGIYPLLFIIPAFIVACGALVLK